MKGRAWLLVLVLGLAMSAFIGCRDEADSSQVLLDETGAVEVGTKSRFTTAAAPADGTIAFIVTWTATNLDGSPHPAGIILSFDVNEGIMTNAGTGSPWEGRVGVPAGSVWTLVIQNGNAGTIANVHVQAVWSKD